MSQNELAYHETADLHELMNMKTIGLLKSKFIQGIVFDQDLRKLLEKNVQASIKDLKELQRIYPYSKTNDGSEPVE